MGRTRHSRRLAGAPLGPWLGALSGAVAAIGIACASSFGAEPASPEEPPESGTEAGASPEGAAPAPEAAVCPAVSESRADSGVRTATGVRSTKLKVIDGVLDDWSECRAISLDRQTVDLAYEDGGIVKSAAKVAIEWDPSAVYVAVEVTGALAAGDASAPYQNDSSEIFVAGSAEGGGSYGPTDHHYVVDYSGTSVEYPPPAGSPAVPYEAAAARRTANGYQIEMRVEAKLLGGDLAAGKQLGFDVMLNDGSNQASYLIWAETPHASCRTCTAGCMCNLTPAFDTTFFGTLTLE